MFESDAQILVTLYILALQERFAIQFVQHPTLDNNIKVISNRYTCVPLDSMRWLNIDGEIDRCTETCTWDVTVATFEAPLDGKRDYKFVLTIYKLENMSL